MSVISTCISADGTAVTPTENKFPVADILAAEDARRRAWAITVDVERRHQPHCLQTTSKGLCSCTPTLVINEQRHIRD